MIRSYAFLGSVKRKMVFFALVIFLVVSNGFSQPLRTEIFNIIQSVKADVGVAIKHLERGDTLSFSGTSHFPMQSVFKFPLAIAVLHHVDEGKLSLQQKVLIRKDDFIPNTWSPIADKFPNGNVELSIEELLSYTVSQSDNNGCDILFGLVGGAHKVHEYFQGRGLDGIAIVHNEREMHRRWDAQFENFSEPSEMVNLLELFYQRQMLSKPSQDLLMGMMLETITGLKRLKGMLPEGTSVAHRTGMSSTDQHGVRAALNDVGIVTLPNGSHVAIAVFISNTREDSSKLESVIAKIAKATFDFYSSK